MDASISGKDMEDIGRLPHVVIYDDTVTKLEVTSDCIKVWRGSQVHDTYVRGKISLMVSIRPTDSDNSWVNWPMGDWMEQDR